MDNQANGNSRVDHQRIAAAVREILLAIGENPDREGLQKTPDRVARMYAEPDGRGCARIRPST